MRKNAGDACREIGYRPAHYDRVEGANGALGWASALMVARRSPGWKVADVLILQPRMRDVGQFQVRRLLPAAKRQAVGPFLFFDHFGPEELEPFKDNDVRAHPHIGLSTVTYLFEGRMVHRDSIGSVQLIEPGAVNWMTAGRGIAHSERTPP